MTRPTPARAPKRVVVNGVGVGDWVSYHHEPNLFTTMVGCGEIAELFQSEGGWWVRLKDSATRVPVHTVQLRDPAKPKRPAKRGKGRK